MNGKTERMRIYNVKWLESHEATVDAEDEILAKGKAMEYSQGHSTLDECFSFVVNGREVKRW